MQDFRDATKLDTSGYLQPETKAEAIALLRAGNSVVAVSELLGLHIESIRRWSRDLRLT